MLINPLIVAATAAARAIGSITGGDWASNRRPNDFRRQHGDPSSNVMFAPTTEYLNFDMMMEDELNLQARELKQFMTPDNPPIKFEDAEILNKDADASATTTTIPDTTIPKPPPLPDRNNPYILLGVSQGDDYDTIRAAYKKMAKIYHPDVIVGPDATAEERTVASWDFARINSAFDILKRREEEQVFEYEMYVDGNRETRSVVAPSSDDERDPYNINFDRIIQNRIHYPQERMWYEEKNRYDEPKKHNTYRRPRHYDDNESYTVDAYTKGKWWVAKGYHDHDNVHYQPLADVDYGPIQSREEQMWGEERGSGVGFGVVNPQEQDAWYDRFAPEPWNNNFQQNNHGDMSEGYPYKNERIGFEDEFSYPPVVTYDDYDPQNEHYPVREKWWKGDETITGQFSP